MTCRVWVEDELRVGVELPLSPEESHYLTRVRRARLGAAIELMNGRDDRHLAEILHLDPRASVVRVTEALSTPPLPPVDLGLAIVDPKAALEAVARACEAGATTVTWIAAERSQGLPPSASRTERVLRASMRQCGRPRPPQVGGPLALSQWLAQGDGRPCWLACTQTGPGAALRAPSAVGARLLIGPEGGWSDAERTRAVEGGAVPLWLGPFVLRTEHAVLAGLTLLMAGPP